MKGILYYIIVSASMMDAVHGFGGPVKELAVRIADDYYIFFNRERIFRSSIKDGESRLEGVFEEQEIEVPSELVSRAIYYLNTEAQLVDEIPEFLDQLPDIEDLYLLEDVVEGNPVEPVEPKVLGRFSSQTEAWKVRDKVIEEGYESPDTLMVTFNMKYSGGLR